MNNNYLCPRCQQPYINEARYDARGIYITRCCDTCWEEVRKTYRPEVLTDSNYETDDQIEEDGT